VSVSSPSRSDPVARVASAIAGGPAGRRLAPSAGFWRALPVLVLMAALTMSFAVLQKQHCRADGWSTPDQFWHACYSDIPVLYSSEGLGAAPRPTLMEALGADGLGQAPVPGVLMWAVSALVDSSPAVSAPRRFFDYSAILLAVALITAVIAVALAAGRRRRWDGAHLALAPMLIGAGLLSYELVAVALVALTLWAWSRSRPLLAGVFAGLAACSRPATAVLAFAVLGVCLRAGRARAWATMALTGFGVWLAVRLILFPAPVQALGDSWQAWKASTPGYGSLWLVPSLLLQSKPAGARFWYTGPAIDGAVSTTITLLGLVAVAVATLTLALSTRYRPRIAHLALFAMACTLLVTKAYPVQAALILLPLIALAGLPWRDHLIWAGAELAHFVGVWLFIAASSDANRGLPAGFYLVLLLLRVAGTVWLAVQAVRMARDPLVDPVRVPVDPAEGPASDDDPAGGVVDDVRDALVVKLR
jgi:hypothetical protein